jgi:hypothetical protein
MTAEIPKLLEIIGFDIILLGVLTLLLVVSVPYVWHYRRGGVKLARERAARRLRLISGDLSPTSEPGATAEKGHPLPGFTRGAVILLIAASLGVFMNLAADELLEFVPAHNWWKWDEKGTEDGIKGIVVEELLRDAGSGSEYLSLNESKLFFQQAYVRMLANTNTEVTNMLRFEFLELRLMRVLFVGALTLWLTATLGMIVTFGSFLGPVVHWQWKRDQEKISDGELKNKLRELAAHHGKRIARSMGMFFCLGLATVICLDLCGSQQKRYGKKLAHAYLALAAKEQPHLPLEHLLAFSRKPREISNLETIPNLIALGEFTNAGGGFEFSGATATTNLLIVMDDETTQLNESNSAGIRDAGPQAFFKVSLHVNKPPQVKRAGTNAFTSFLKTYEDLEGITSRDNFVYCIGSHSTPKNAAKRAFFARFAIGTNDDLVVGKVLNPVVTNFAPYFVGLKEEADWDVSSGTNPVVSDLNIEGLAAIPRHQGLYIGLRGPLAGKFNEKGQRKAYVMHLLNPDELFDKTNAAPKFSLLKPIDLGGQGISSLEYDPLTESLLIAASDSIENDRVEPGSSLWRWSLPLEKSKPVKLMTFVGHKLEGVARVPQGMKHDDCLLLTFDDEVNTVGSKRNFGRIAIVRWNPY